MHAYKLWILRFDELAKVVNYDFPRMFGAKTIRSDFGSVAATEPVFN